MIKQKILTSLILVLILCSSLFADIAELKDSTILVGKVTKNQTEFIVFKNAYGEFTIQKNLIQKLFITKHYNEDISIFRQLGKEADEAVIKKNYNAGLAGTTYPEEKQQKNKDQKTILILNNFKKEISVSSSYMFVTGKLREIIENGFSINLTYITPPDIVPGIELRKWMPMITADLSYQHYEEENSRINGITILAGSSWDISFFRTQYGSIKAGFLGGLSAFAIAGENSSTSTTTFTTEVFTGYSKTFDSISLSCCLKYLYVYDRDIDLNALGFSIGAGYRF